MEKADNRLSVLFYKVKIMEKTFGGGLASLFIRCYHEDVRNNTFITKVGI